jgi:hypothetical protein
MAEDGERVKRRETLSCADVLRVLWLVADGSERLRMRRLAEGVGFEPTRERNPLPVFKTGALNHSATLPSLGRSAA